MTKQGHGSRMVPCQWHHPAGWRMAPSWQAMAPSTTIHQSMAPSCRHHHLCEPSSSSRMAHKARALDQFIQQSTPDSTDLEDWLSKSSDLNMMDYCIWSMLLTELQSCEHDTHSIDDLKTSLGRV